MVTGKRIFLLGILAALVTGCGGGGDSDSAPQLTSTPDSVGAPEIQTTADDESGGAVGEDEVVSGLTAGTSVAVLERTSVDDVFDVYLFGTVDEAVSGTRSESPLLTDVAIGGLFVVVENQSTTTYGAFSLQYDGGSLFAYKAEGGRWTVAVATAGQVHDLASADAMTEADDPPLVIATEETIRIVFSDESTFDNEASLFDLARFAVGDDECAIYDLGSDGAHLSRHIEDGACLVNLLSGGILELDYTGGDVSGIRTTAQSTGATYFESVNEISFLSAAADGSSFVYTNLDEGNGILESVMVDIDSGSRIADVFGWAIASSGNMMATLNPESGHLELTTPKGTINTDYLEYFPDSSRPSVAAFSPDGGNLLLGIREGMAPYRVSLVDTTSGTLTELASFDGTVDLRWLSNSELLVVDDHGSGILDLGGAWTMVAERPTRVQSESQGQWILLTSNEKTDIFSIASQEIVSTFTGDVWDYRSDRDEMWLAVLLRRQSGIDLVVVEISTGLMLEIQSDVGDSDLRFADGFLYYSTDSEMMRIQLGLTSPEAVGDGGIFLVPSVRARYSHRDFSSVSY